MLEKGIPLWRKQEQKYTYSYIKTMEPICHNQKPSFFTVFAFTGQRKLLMASPISLEISLFLVTVKEKKQKNKIDYYAKWFIRSLYKKETSLLLSTNLCQLILCK